MARAGRYGLSRHNAAGNFLSFLEDALPDKHFEEQGPFLDAYLKAAGRNRPDPAEVAAQDDRFVVLFSYAHEGMLRELLPYVHAELRTVEC